MKAKPMAQRYLIVNADDFGLSAGVNQGIIEAHERGIVTSASLMVRWPAAAEAAAYCQTHPRLSLGLHFDLGEWVFRNGEWSRVYGVALEDDITAVAREACQQLERFRQLVGRDPTHLDSHQHVHRSEPTRSLLLLMAQTLAIPLRHVSPTIHYCGDFYGQTGKGEPCPEAITVEKLINTVQGLPMGITELGCHPGLDEELDSVYGKERTEEVRVLCDPQVRAAIAAEGIVLCSFRDISAIPAEINPES